MCRWSSHLSPPRILEQYWSLAVLGAVQHPLILSYSDASEFPVTEVICDTYCAQSPNDASFLQTGTWSGVRVSELLSQAVLLPEVQSARLYSADGEMVSMPLSWLQRGLLAFVLDEEALTPFQGFPVRLVIPSLAACFSPRWLERIELVREPAAEPAVAGSHALFGMPSIIAAAHATPILLHGRAYHGAEGMRGVRLSIDDGEWLTIPVDSSPNRFSNWSAQWIPPTNGKYSITVQPITGFSPTETTHYQQSVFHKPAQGHSIIVEVS